jgi:hypothetical protein
MHEASSGETPTAGLAIFSRRWSDPALLAVLLFLAAGLRLWIVTHAAVGARDSIGYIRYALQLESQGWSEVVPKQKQHPLYPLAILAVSKPVRFLAGDSDPQTLLRSAQLVSLLAGVLLVVPVYYLGKELFDRHVGFWSAALFQCLPGPAQVTSDALSDGLFLLWMAGAMLLAVQALRTGSAVRFGQCGVLGGLAYLTRPEGAFVTASTLATLLGLQIIGRRFTWRRALAGGACLVLASLAVAGPYLAATGRLTNKPTPRDLLQLLRDEDEWRTEVRAAPPDAVRPQDRGPPLAVLGVWWNDVRDQGRSRVLWALESVVEETVKTSLYLTSPLALVGMWWFWPRFRRVPGSWVPFVLCLGHSLVLWRLAVVAGYVSERHTLILVLCHTFWAVALLSALVDWSAERWLSPGHRPWLLTAVLLVFVGLGLPIALRPMHTNRLAHREAGLWLADHARPFDLIVDPFAWAHFYAGRVLHDGTLPPRPRGERPNCYVVIEDSDHTHSRLTGMAQAQSLAAKGTLVWQSPPTCQPRVKIYSVSAAQRKPPRRMPTDQNLMSKP